jgi:5-oxoprolinase (ATP-hydrolysing) subunit B
MFAADGSDPAAKPLVLPLGESALLVRFGSTLSEPANIAALGFARILALRPIAGVVEVVPNLVSVLLRYEPQTIGFYRLTGEIGLLLTATMGDTATQIQNHVIKVAFGGEGGPDLNDVAERLGLSAAEFVAAHNASRLRVLATGFAPGFVYCGFHPESLHVPRRAEVRPRVAAGSVLFAAGQTAIAATDIPTGWHVIGHTQLRNFDALRDPPTLLQAGDTIDFEATA